MTSRAIVNPATEEVLADVEDLDVDRVDSMIAHGVNAMKGWSEADPAYRANVLFELADRVEQNMDRLSRIESDNVGKPIRDARDEVAMVVDVFRYYAGAVDKFYGDTIPVANGVDLTFREPVGLVGVIVPWNFPLAIASWKSAAALAAGNTVLLKPASQTPLSALELELLTAKCGVPPGVFQVVCGAGGVVGKRLVDHPGVAKISFTGSTDVGRDVMRGSSEQLKRFTLELGGKSANIIFADADLDKAAHAAPAAVFGNAGQDCCARSRILIQRDAYDAFLERLISACRSVKVGDPASEVTQMGPLISESQRRSVASYVDRSAVFQGDVPGGPGFWFPPTVLAPIDNAHRAAQEEIFGPVVCVIPFADEREAISIANDSAFGLSASIWTENAGQAFRVARALEVGTVSVNSNTSVRVATPFGGFKQSGIGRELGMEGLVANSELKNVYLATS